LNKFDIYFKFSATDAVPRMPENDWVHYNGIYDYYTGLGDNLKSHLTHSDLYWVHCAPLVLLRLFMALARAKNLKARPS
jgi:hypothetical protein